MNEIEKMRNGLLADFTAPEVQESFRIARLFWPGSVQCPPTMPTIVPFWNS